MCDRVLFTREAPLFLLFFCVMRGLRNFAESSDIGCEGVASFSVCEDRIQDTIVMEI